MLEQLIAARVPRVQPAQKAALRSSEKKISAAAEKTRGTVTTFLALMAASAPLGAEFRPAGRPLQSERETKTTRETELGATGTLQGCRASDQA